MKSQISVPLIPGDVSYLDVLTVIVKLWTSIDLKLQSPQSVFGILFFFFFLAFRICGSGCHLPSG